MRAPLVMLSSNNVNWMHRRISKRARGRANGATHPAPKAVHVVLRSIMPLLDAPLGRGSLKKSSLPERRISNGLRARPINDVKLNRILKHPVPKPGRGWVLGAPLQLKSTPSEAAKAALRVRL